VELMPRAEERPTVVLGTTCSDSHTWNLVFLELLLEEAGYTVVNLGACTPEPLYVEACLRSHPSFVVVSSVNGHGRSDAEPLIQRIREQAELRELPVALGGKLGTSGRLEPEEVRALVNAGFTMVFQDDAREDRELGRFTAFLSAPEKAVSRAITAN